jgi:hypothetical protein
VQRQDGEARRVRLAVGRVDAAGPRRAVAAADDVCTDDMVPVRVQGAAGADELFPPAGRRVGRVGARVRRGGQAGVQQDGVGAVGVEAAPGLVGDGEGREEAAPVEEEGGVAVEGLGGARGVGGLGAG